MRAEHRLRSTRDIERVFREGSRVTRPEFVLYHFAREASERPRVSFAVARQIGGAVARNRLRRLLREAVRPLLDRLVACDIVVVARPALAGTGLRDLERALADAASEAGLLQD